MAQWNSIEDETGMTYDNNNPHFAWENGHAAIRTEDVDVSAAVIDGRLLKVIVTDNDAAEAVGFVAMREKTALSVGADLGVIDLLADITATDLMAGDGTSGAIVDANFTIASTWTFATNTFTRTAGAGNPDIVHDTACVAGVLYRIQVTYTRTAGNLTAQVGANDGAAAGAGTSIDEYVRATDTTAPTLQADATFAGTVTAFSVKAIDETAYTLSTSNTHGIVGTLLQSTWVDGDDFMTVTLDDLLQSALTVGKLYKIVVNLDVGAGDTVTAFWTNVGGVEVMGVADAVATTIAAHTWYIHYEEGMELHFAGGDAADVLSLDLDTWTIKEVERMGTDALVIMNSDGDKYCWDSFEATFDKNSDDYTFDIYEMRGGVSGETRLGTEKQTFMTEGLIERSTSRDSTMEYPDHKDMEDFD